MELAIDTSTRFASIGLSKQGESVVELTWRSERNHSVELVPSIMQMLERTQCGVGDIEAIYIAIGPGGFSALRVGMSAAKMMAASLGVPLVGVGTLAIEAQPYVGMGRTVYGLIGAGRNRLYVGEFRGGAEPLYGVVSHDDFLEELRGRDAGDEVIFCGEGAAAVAEVIGGEVGEDAKIADVPPPTRRAGVLAAMGHEMLAAGRVADAASLEPLYLRSSQVDMANRTWQRK